MHPEPGCMMQIGAGLRIEGSSGDVVHPVELLDHSYQRAGVLQVSQADSSDGHETRRARHRASRLGSVLPGISARGHRHARRGRFVRSGTQTHGDADGLGEPLRFRMHTPARTYGMPSVRGCLRSASLARLRCSSRVSHRRPVVRRTPSPLLICSRRDQRRGRRCFSRTLPPLRVRDDRIIDDFGVNSLITGRIVEALVAEDACGIRIGTTRMSSLPIRFWHTSRRVGTPRCVTLWRFPSTPAGRLDVVRLRGQRADHRGRLRTLEYVHGMKDEFVDFLSGLCRVESPTDHPATQTSVHALLEPAFTDLGYEVRIVEGRKSGNHLLAMPKRRSKRDAQPAPDGTQRYGVAARRRSSGCLCMSTTADSTDRVRSI